MISLSPIFSIIKDFLIIGEERSKSRDMCNDVETALLLLVTDDTFSLFIKGFECEAAMGVEAGAFFKCLGVEDGRGLIAVEFVPFFDEVT